MRAAIPIWNNRVSPVFESAGTLVVLEIEKGQQKARTEFQMTYTTIPLKVKWLVDHNIDVLICGAISCPSSNMIVSSGISIIPWICGDFDKVVKAVLTNGLPHPDFTMPGCCCRRMQARHRGRDRNRGGHGTGHRGRQGRNSGNRGSSNKQ